MRVDDVASHICRALRDGKMCLAQLAAADRGASPASSSPSFSSSSDCGEHGYHGIKEELYVLTDNVYGGVTTSDSGEYGHQDLKKEMELQIETIIYDRDAFKYFNRLRGREWGLSLDVSCSP